jgi:peroxiredoxin
MAGRPPASSGPAEAGTGPEDNVLVSRPRTRTDVATGRLSRGETALDFEATFVTPDGDAAPMRFSRLLEERPILLNFYTMDFSPDCVSEWCSFQDFEWFTSNDDVGVVGVSKSGPAMHEKFIGMFDPIYPLYADTDLKISEAFEVDYRAMGLFRRARRSCFLVDQDRTIRYNWLGEHWLDPTRDTPPIDEIHRAIVEELDGEETPAF